MARLRTNLTPWSQTKTLVIISATEAVNLLISLSSFGLVNACAETDRTDSILVDLSEGRDGETAQEVPADRF